MSYVSNTETDVKEMLAAIGVSSLDDLFSDIPQEIQLKKKLPLPSPLSEIEIDAQMHKLASLGKTGTSFLGAGAYNHHIPSAVDQLTLRSEFYTAYTPYQPEISQGTLIAIFEYQTMLCRLTGMDVANASMYDGATSLTESVMMSARTNNRSQIIIPDSLHPHYREVLKTYAWANGFEIITVLSGNGIFDAESLKKAVSEKTTAVVVQSPNFFGCIEDLSAIADIAHSVKAHLIHVVTEALALGLLAQSGSLGADIVCGEAQSFGNHVGFGGPYLGLLAAKEPFVRRMPGRLVGRTVDTDGKTAYCLTLQTREQHIRRDKATSNICSNQGLCALRAVIYLSLVGNNLRELAKLNHNLASYLRKRCAEKGLTPLTNNPYFNEFAVKAHNADTLIEKMLKEGISFGVNLGKWYPEYRNCILLNCTELVTPEEIDRVMKLV
jgi:glycine dehydrogenase subunit 1